MSLRPVSGYNAGPRGTQESLGDRTCWRQNRRPVGYVPRMALAAERARRRGRDWPLNGGGCCSRHEDQDSFLQVCTEYITSSLSRERGNEMCLFPPPASETRAWRPAMLRPRSRGCSNESRGTKPSQKKHHNKSLLFAIFDEKLLPNDALDPLGGEAHILIRVRAEPQRHVTVEESPVEGQDPVYVLVVERRAQGVVVQPPGGEREEDVVDLLIEVGECVFDLVPLRSTEDWCATV